MDELFSRAHRRHVSELNIVPIIDLLTTVIFFLLYSTNFIDFTKLTVPPSRVSTITKPETPPPLNPKFYALKDGNNYQLIMTWAGSRPGIKLDKFVMDPKKIQGEKYTDLIKTSEKMVSEFTKNYPVEKTLQLGLGRNVEYQALIAIMDGVRFKMADLVLVSYNEADVQNKLLKDR